MDNRLKELRKQNGISLKKLSQKLNELYGITVSDSQLSYYENGKRSPRNGEVWIYLANFFNVPVSYLLGYQDPVKYLAWECNIPKLRKEKGISQETLSKETSIPLEIIKEWENNNGSYSAEQLKKLEEYFEVPIPEIIGYSIAHSELRNVINVLSEDSKQKLLTYAKDLKALEDFNKANNP
jgi:orf32